MEVPLRLRVMSRTDDLEGSAVSGLAVAFFSRLSSPYSPSWSLKVAGLSCSSPVPIVMPSSSFARTPAQWISGVKGDGTYDSWAGFSSLANLT